MIHPRLCNAKPNFYPRSPCGERPIRICQIIPIIQISIHALLAESDIKRRHKKHLISISIHALLAESDHFDNFNLHCVEISIHALLAESDIVTVGLLMFNLYFYPRSPCGERLVYLALIRYLINISIHALLAESDFRNLDAHCQTTAYFYPRSPCGERP